SRSGRAATARIASGRGTRDLLRQLGALELLGGDRAHARPQVLEDERQREHRDRRREEDHDRLRLLPSLQEMRRLRTVDRLDDHAVVRRDASLLLMALEEQLQGGEVTAREVPCALRRRRDRAEGDDRQDAAVLREDGERLDDAVEAA